MLRARTFIHVQLHVHALIFLPSLHLRPKYFYRVAWLQSLLRSFRAPDDTSANRVQHSPEIRSKNRRGNRDPPESFDQTKTSFFLFVSRASSARRFEELRERIFLRRELIFRSRRRWFLRSSLGPFFFCILPDRIRGIVRFVGKDFALEFSDDKCGINWKFRRKRRGRLIRDRS